MTHPPFAAPVPPRAPARRAHRLRRSGAMLALAAAVGAAGLGCSKTDQVATDQSTTVAPATTKPAADASGAPGGTGSTVSTTPGTMAITTSTTARAASTTVTTGSGPSTTITTDTVAPTIPQETSSTVPGTAEDAAFCAKGLEIQNKLKGIDPTKDPAATMAQYKKVFAELTAAAPPELKADINQINQIIQSMTSFDSEPPDADKLEAAGQRVDDWAIAHCGKSFSG